MKYFIFFISIVLCSCGSPDPEKMKDHLGGYWEIEEVLFPDGNKKTFTINTTVDYIEVKGNSGVRKKVSPQLDGSFKSFEQSEQFNIIVRNDSLILHYITPFAAWEETVKEANEKRLFVINEEGKEYHYKQFQPITVIP